MSKELILASHDYPKLLAQVPDAPKQLYYKGFLHSSIFENCLAVVGSRQMSHYGKHATQKLVYEVAKRGITIVSGFMYGVDATAHRTALDAGGKTIAVMPCGIDTIHPYYQLGLYEDILAGGLILSEYAGSSQPQLWTYPKRNRIVAGLCKAVLVVEASLDSGSLITAGFAKSFGRQIFAVPGPITSTNSQGTLNLIKQGACLVRNPEDILVQFNIMCDMPLFENLVDDTDELITQLLREPLNLDELSDLLRIGASELGSRITSLLIEGKIIQEGTKYYVN